MAQQASMSLVLASVDATALLCQQQMLVTFFVYLVVIGLLYMAYPDGCQHEFTFLPRLRPYPMRGRRLLYAGHNQQGHSFYRLMD